MPTISALRNETWTRQRKWHKRYMRQTKITSHTPTHTHGCCMLQENMPRLSKCLKQQTFRKTNGATPYCNTTKQSNKKQKDENKNTDNTPCHHCSFLLMRRFTKAKCRFTKTRCCFETLRAGECG